MDRRLFINQCLGCTAGLAFLTLPGFITGLRAEGGSKSKEEILRELEEKAAKFMPLVRACSSASFAALNEQFNLKADKAIRPLMPFGGGIAGRQETCGAVTGSVLALGFVFEPKNEQELAKMGGSLKGVRRFVEGFTRAFGSTRCREVVKHQFGRYYDFSKPEDMKGFMEAGRKSNKCLEVVQKAVRIAGEIILEKS